MSSIQHIYKELELKKDESFFLLNGKNNTILKKTTSILRLLLGIL